MGKAKKLMEEHDRDIVKLSELLTEAFALYRRSTISTVEFVGNLEAAKFMALSEVDKAKDELDGELDVALDELLDAIFGDKKEEEE